METSRMKVVYNITERDGRSFWSRIGVAFVNKDGSLNVRLESLPVDGEMQVRDYVPREESETNGRFGESNGRFGEELAAQAA